jgi:hypothetical protein
MDYNPLFDRLWGADGVHPFGNPDRFDEYMKMGQEGLFDYQKREREFMEEYQRLEEEVFEFLRGDFKTTIVCKFNRQGYLVSHSVESINISQDLALMEELREELYIALDEERYEDAKRLQEDINKLREITEVRKPTL